MQIDRRRLASLADTAKFAILAPLFGLGTGMLVSYLQGAAVWGQIVGFQLVTILAANFAGWGLRENALPDMAKAPHRAFALWRSHFVTRLVLLAPPFAIAASAMVSLDDIARPGWIALLVGCWVPLVLTIRAFDAFANFVGVLGRVAWINMSWSLIQLLAVAVLASRSAFSVTALLAVLVLVDLGRLLSRVVVLRNSLQRPSTAKEGLVRPALLASGTRLALSSFIPSLSGRMDTLLVALFLNDQWLGLHNLVVAIFGFVRVSAGLSSIALAPKIVRMPMRTVWKLARLNFRFGLFVSPAAGLGAWWLLTRALDLPVPVLVILCAAVASLPVFGSSLLIYRAQSCQVRGQLFWIGTAGLAVQLAASLVLLPWYGLVGAQLAMLTGECYRFVAAVSLFRGRQGSARLAG